MAKFTIEALGAEMEVLAQRMRQAQESDKTAILAQMDALALRSAQLTGQKAEELKARLDTVAARFEAASENRFKTLSDELHDSVVDILGNLQEIKTGQKFWGNSIMGAIKDLGNRLGSFVSTPAIVIEGIVSVIIGIVVGVLIKGGATKVMERVYDENLTPIGQVPRFDSAFEQYGLAVCFGILATVVVFAITYGVTKLIVRHRKS